MDVYAILQKDDYQCAFCSSDDNLQTHSLNFSSHAANPIVTICENCLQSERKYRKNEEKNLLNELRSKRFGFQEVYSIAHGINNMTEFHVPSVMASVISWTLGDEDIMRKLCEMYFDDLAKKRGNLQSDNIDDLPF